MTMIRRVVPAQITAMGDDEVEIVMSTAFIARDGHILMPEGCILDNYRRNPIQLWQHDPDHPVGRNEDIQVRPDAITALCRFAPLGISRKADEIRGLVKARILNAVSVGFDVLESEPLDPKKPRGGLRITKWELLECSFVSVPADTLAVVTARANKDHNMTDEPERTAEIARALKLARARVRRDDTKPVFKRGLYGVAQLAYLVAELGYTKQEAEWEAAIEEDSSKVPGMIGEALMTLGEALVAMTQEEVAELMANVGIDVEIDDDEEPVARTHAEAWGRAKLALTTRAGKKMSDEMVSSMREMQEDHEDALNHTKEAQRLHKRAMAKGDCMLDAAGANEPAADKDAPDPATKHAAEIGVPVILDVSFRRRQADKLRLSPAIH
jgi:HK97 family phage prohead protease